MFSDTSPIRFEGPPLEDAYSVVAIITATLVIALCWPEKGALGFTQDVQLAV